MIVSRFIELKTEKGNTWFMGAGGSCSVCGAMTIDNEEHLKNCSFNKTKNHDFWKEHKREYGFKPGYLRQYVFGLTNSIPRQYFKGIEITGEGAPGWDSLKNRIIRHDGFFTAKEKSNTKFSKPRFTLIPAKAEEEVARVLTKGADEHGGDNSYLSSDKQPYEVRMSKARRHMNAFWQGQEKDQDSGYHPLAHAICQLMFLLEYELRGLTDLDDRPKNG